MRVNNRELLLAAIILVTSCVRASEVLSLKTKRSAPQNMFKDRARSNQKSLLIIFDSTGSMGTDLAQLKAAARSIVTELSKHEHKPIYNYILVEFNDPSKLSIYPHVKPQNQLTHFTHRG